jgi:hypothetical protein
MAEARGGAGGVRWRRGATASSGGGLMGTVMTGKMSRLGIGLSGTTGTYGGCGGALPQPRGGGGGGWGEVDGVALHADGREEDMHGGEENGVACSRSCDRGPNINQYI